jgi:hypothetical protein
MSSRKHGRNHDCETIAQSTGTADERPEQRHARIQLEWREASRRLSARSLVFEGRPIDVQV